MRSDLGPQVVSLRHRRVRVQPRGLLHRVDARPQRVDLLRGARRRRARARLDRVRVRLRARDARA
eukprot:31250-Pelagococcus_subviridis.AAC.2